MWTIAALAIIGGGQLLRVVSLTVITRVAAGVMLALAVLSALQAL